MQTQITHEEVIQILTGAEEELWLTLVPKLNEDEAYTIARTYTKFLAEEFNRYTRREGHIHGNV